VIGRGAVNDIRDEDCIVVFGDQISLDDLHAGPYDVCAKRRRGPPRSDRESKPRLVLLDEGEVAEEAAAEVLWADARHPYGCAASQADLDAHRQ